MAAQGIGQDFVDLFIVVPILLISLVYMRKNNKTATLLFGGTIFYILYSFIIYCFGVHFNQLFLIYCATLGLSLYIFIIYMMEMHKTEIQNWFKETMPNKLFSYFLIIVAVLFYLIWLKDVIPAIIGSYTPKLISDNNLLVNPVHVIDIAIAFGLKVGFGRLGTFAALQISPVVAQDGLHLTNAIWLAAILTCIGLLAFVVYMLFDAKLDKQTIQEEETKTEKDNFSFKDIADILGNRAYLYIALLCVTFYSAVFPFLAFAPDFISDKFGFNDIQSGRIVSLLPFATAFFTPFFGSLIDRKGRSATAMMFGSIALITVHLLFGFTNITPYIPLIFLGIAFSLVPAAMWPSMVKLVDEKKIGTAYGLMYSIQNLGLWGFPILAGIILDRTNPGNPEVSNYTPTILMFALLGVFGLFFAFMLKREDKKGNFGVELPLNKK